MTLGCAYSDVELVPAVASVRAFLVDAFLEAASGDPVKAQELCQELPGEVAEIHQLVLLAYTVGAKEKFNEGGFDLSPDESAAFERVRGGLDGGDVEVSVDDYVRQGLHAYFGRVNADGSGKLSCGDIVAQDIAALPSLHTPS